MGGRLEKVKECMSPEYITYTYEIVKEYIG